MGSLFSTLGIGYSGLSAAQVGINTTGNNIANAETEGYTRQRVIATAATPLSTQPGNVGNGVVIQDIKRVFDSFVFNRYSKVASDKEYSDFEQQTLEELSTYFPEIDNVGIKSDLTEYYNMWQSLADNPDNDSIKVALAKQTETLTTQLFSVQEKIDKLQSQMNEQLNSNIQEVNAFAKQLAELNRSIDTAESGGSYTASDLRDKRNVIELSLSKLIGAEVNVGQIEAATLSSRIESKRTGSYTLSVNGFNIVDGTSFHPINVSNKESRAGFYEVSYERQDGILIPMTEEISGGRIGAILSLRGGKLDTTSGMPIDGIIQTASSQLDAFAKGLIESTNNLYASGATKKMESNIMTLDASSSLVGADINIKVGSFDMVVYDLDGNQVAVRNIKIDTATSMSGAVNSNSIEGQILANIDDNSDLSANNDLDDFIDFSYNVSANGDLKLELGVNATRASQGYTFAIVDKLTDTSFTSGTNFAGALGTRRFFDGNDASSIELTSEFKNNPTKITAGLSGLSGDNELALNMVQQQFESYDYKVGGQIYNTTVYGMFDVTSTYVGIATNSAISRNETISTQFNATQKQYYSVSKVSIDEEMTNLIKYQTSYGAAAKLITTIDQMMQTLLGIKQ